MPMVDARGSGRTLATRLRFWLMSAAQGAGRPTAKDVLEEQYDTGGWKHLDSLPEMAPCIMVAGYIRHLFDRPRLLDIGCGHGRLGRLLNASGMRRYVGVDVSSNAVKQARDAGIANASFVVADLEQWLPNEEFDVVAFVDSVYYARDPLAILRRYSNILAPDGVFVMSMFRYSNNGVILRKLERHFDVVHGSTVRNQTGGWEIRILRPPAGERTPWAAAARNHASEPALASTP